MEIRAAKSERGWELEYLFFGVWAFGPEDESEVFPTQQDAEDAAKRERALAREGNRPDEFDLACERRFD